MKGFVVVSVLVGLVLVSVYAAPMALATFDSPLPPPGPLPGPGDVEVLRALLMQLISGGLASVAVYWFLDTDLGWAAVDVLVEGLARMRMAVPWPEMARYTAIVLAGAISMGAYLVGLAFGFVPDPGSMGAWVNLALVLLGVSFTGSQVIHGRVQTLRS